MKGESFSVQKLISDYLAEEYRRSQREPKDYWRVSDMGHCLRGRYYKRQGAKPTDPPDERTLRKFQAGNIFHWWLQRQVRYAASEMSGVRVIGMEREVRNDKLHVVGHYDALVQIGRKKLLYDFKTVHSNAFHYREQNKSLTQKQHAMQLGLYLMLLHQEHPDLTEARLLYISKDDLSVAETKVILTPALKREILRELKILNESWEKKKLPPTPPLIVKDSVKNKWVINWQAQYCPYHDLCMNEPKEVWMKEAREAAELKNIQLKKRKKVRKSEN
jgi:hypothetical protein